MSKKIELYISHDAWTYYTIRPNDPGPHILKPLRMHMDYFHALRPDIAELPLGELGIVINGRKKRNKK